MKIGFTGTQQGMTDRQNEIVERRLGMWKEEGCEFHHGDCVGADEEAAAIARSLGYKIHSHPPANGYLRAYAPYDVIYDTKPYLERNHDIVDAVELMLATPKEPNEILRSGTWATIRYAKKTGTKIYVFKPEAELQISSM